LEGAANYGSAEVPDPKKEELEEAISDLQG
jgi:hypothetical protein